MSEQDPAWWQARIRALMKTVPERVRHGNHNITSTYLEAVKFANKYVGAPRATLKNLRDAYQRLNAYES